MEDLTHVSGGFPQENFVHALVLLTPVPHFAVPAGPNLFGRSSRINDRRAQPQVPETLSNRRAMLALVVSPF